jgi:catechol 2,3-dioxygenase
MAREYGIRPPEYRLPEATHVGRVRLQVSDLGRSVDYYQQVIGLGVIRRDAASAALGPAHADTVLVELHERRGVRPVPPHGRFGLYHFALLVPNRADLGRFAGHLADVDARVASADHLVSEALYLWDPDGLGIEVYADRPRSEWRARGNELTMATEPLDVRGLVRAAHGAAWSALPLGTVIGHVHLHVGSLHRAEALYHTALGLDKVVWSFPGALFLSAGGYHHHLAVNTWAEGAASPGDEDARLLEWELVLSDADNVAAAAASVSGSGYRVSNERGDPIVSDDWGTRLRLTTAPD